MVPIFGIDLTENKKNRQLNGSEFLVQTPSAAITQTFARSSEKAAETVNRAKLPLPLRIVQWSCGAIGAMVALGILRGLGSVTIEEAYHNAGSLFWVAGGCVLVWAILKIAGMLKTKSVMGQEESIHSLSNLEGVCEAIYAELNVPANAVEVDVLSFMYKRKDGTLKVCEQGVAQYRNPIFKFFADKDNLYLANLEGKYAFPKSSVVGIQAVKKHIRIAEWNKRIPQNAAVFKPYKLTVDQYGCVHCKNYYILELDHNGQRYGLYIPCYELPWFEKATGIKVQ